MSGHGYGTRYDKFTANAIDAAREAAPGVGLYKNFSLSFCGRCQKDKPSKGRKKVGPMFVCADCQVKP